MSRVVSKATMKLAIPMITGVILISLLPLFSGPFYTHILIITFIHIILVMGYRLLYVTGLVSFCHVTFYAIGAYTSAILATKLGLPFGICFLAGGILAAVAAAILLWIGGRLRGPYFFLLSFGFLGVMDSVFRHWRGVTNGPAGIGNIPSIMGLESVVSYYYLFLIFTAITIFIMYRLDRSRFGAELVAIGEADDLAEIIGINVLKHRVLAIAIGALFAGFVGSLFAHYSGFIAPENFTMWLTTYILVWCVIGGAQTVWGPIVGSVLMTFIAEFLRMSGTMQAIFYGVILLIAIMVLPHGIVGLMRTLRARFGRHQYPAGGTKTGTEPLAE